MGLIDEFFRVIAESVYEVDIQYSKGKTWYYWPFNPAKFSQCVAPILAKEFLRLFDELKGEDYTLRDCADLIESPNKLASYQCGLWPVKDLNLNYAEKYRLVKDFISLLIILRNGEPFCEKGRNLVWSKKELKERLDEHEKAFIEVKENPSMAKILSKLEGLLIPYLETLYYYMLDFSRMLHGPYSWNDSIVFVKEYLHLRAGELWNVTSDFPFDHFMEIGIYRNIKITTFFIGHVHSDPSFPKALQRFVVIVDDKIVENEEQLRNLYEKVKEVTQSCVQEMKNRCNDEDFLFKKGLDMFFYPLKPLYTEIGESWKSVLPKVYEFADRIKDRIRVPRTWEGLSREKAINLLIRSMDFRKAIKFS